ncbi:MAG: methyltransferase domain-containing protein [Pyrinomonadaceae bacterium]
MLVGLDFNKRSAASILEESKDYAEIVAARRRAALFFADGAFDYTICSLFTHHFRDDGVIAVLREMARVARQSIFVIDLHRHAAAYFFYTTLGRLVLRNRLVREDGALSIRRGFRPMELVDLARKADLREICVKRFFPFRLVLSGRGKP